MTLDDTHSIYSDAADHDSSTEESYICELSELLFNEACLQNSDPETLEKISVMPTSNYIVYLSL